MKFVMTRCALNHTHHATALYRSAVTGTVEPLCEVCVETLTPRPQVIWFLEWEVAA